MCIAVLSGFWSGAGRGNEQTQVRWLTSGALARTLEAEMPEVELASKNRIYPVVVRFEDREFTLAQGQVDDRFF